jgi:hypothetical protein
VALAINIGTTTPMGRVMAQMVAVFAELEGQSARSRPPPCARLEDSAMAWRPCCRGAASLDS